MTDQTTETVVDQGPENPMDAIMARNGNFLTANAEGIKQLIRNNEEAQAQVLVEWRKVGEMLAEVQQVFEQEKKGKTLFAEWCDQQGFGFSKQWRNRLIRLANYWDEVQAAIAWAEAEGHASRVDVRTPNTALALLAKYQKKDEEPSEEEDAEEQEGEGDDGLATEDEVEALKRRIAELETEVSAKDEELAALRQSVAAKDARIAELEECLSACELPEQVGNNSDEAVDPADGDEDIPPWGTEDDKAGGSPEEDYKGMLNGLSSAQRARALRAFRDAQAGDEAAHAKAVSYLAKAGVAEAENTLAGLLSA